MDSLSWRWRASFPRAARRLRSKDRSSFTTFRCCTPMGASRQLRKLASARGPADISRSTMRRRAVQPRMPVSARGAGRHLANYTHRCQSARRAGAQSRERAIELRAAVGSFCCVKHLARRPRVGLPQPPLRQLCARHPIPSPRHRRFRRCNAGSLGLAARGREHRQRQPSSVVSAFAP
jgi:hypothetical protein